MNYRVLYTVSSQRMHECIYISFWIPTGAQERQGARYLVSLRISGRYVTTRDCSPPRASWHGLEGERQSGRTIITHGYIYTACKKQPHKRRCANVSERIISFWFPNMETNHNTNSSVVTRARAPRAFGAHALLIYN